MSLFGIDVSNHQGRINWPKVKAAGVQFAAMKASEGTGFSDPYFPANLDGARGVEIIPIPYHFCRMDVNADPEPEVSHFDDCLRVAGGLLPGEPCAGDFEVARGASFSASHLASLAHPQEIQPLVRQLVKAGNHRPMLGRVVPPAGVRADPTLAAAGLSSLAWSQTWHDDFKSAKNFEALFYSGLWWMQPNGIVGDARLALCGLWLAAYQATWPPTPSAWPFLTMHQYSDAGAVDGISGPVDMDRFNGDSLDQLRAYGWQAPVPSPGKPQMTNDDYTQVNRILLDGGRLNPVEAAAFLGQFSD